MYSTYMKGPVYPSPLPVYVNVHIMYPLCAYCTCLNEWSLSQLFSAIGRNLIPRYFRSIFNGGASDLSYTLVQPKETYQNNMIVVLDCEKATMTTTYLKPLPTKV